MTVSAVIPHWNRRELLEKLLASMLAQTVGFDEVIVVDNGSTDDSAEMAERVGARVLRLGRNFGFAAAVNRGVEAAASEWVAVLSNGVVLDREWLRVLVGSAERDGVWFATGKILNDQHPEVIDGTFDEISRGGCAWRCGAGQADSEVWNQGRRIRFASMTAGLFRRQLFSEVGPLDKSFGSYLEDVDFGLRCALAGRGGIYEPGAVAWHRGSATLGAWNSDTVRLIARNQVLLTAKHFSGQPRWPILVGQMLWGMLALRHATGIAYLGGKWDGWRASRRVRNISAPGLPAIVEASEREIFELQRQTGFDWYWRIYFWLLRR